MNSAVLEPAILLPMFGVMVLTFVVWVILYVKRIRHMVKERIDPRKLGTPDKRLLLDERVNWPAYNFQNLFELPVLFYFVCLYIYVAQLADIAYLAAAWLFFVLRVVHSAVQITVNIVRLRFAVYMAGALCLWFIVLRAAFDAWSRYL
ncbi:MAG: MAPEG family protein [Pseudomonadota bacterium]